MDRIEDVVRDMVRGWQRDLETEMLGALGTVTTYGTAATIVETAHPPSLELIMRQIEGPWGINTVPHHFDCCEYAAAIIKTKTAASPRFPEFGGMEVRVDKSLPLGRVRIVNADGLVIEEFEIAADALGT